jgi:DMSO/TMAO reductase YedYZ heme-binding membrane subunit
MGSGFGLSGAVGFFYLWPLIFLITVAVYVCIAYSKPESHDGMLTNGGKRMVRSRAFLGVGCAIYYLCISLGVAFKSADEPMLVLGYWDKHSQVFLALIIVAEVSLLIATVYSFRSRGRRNWIRWVSA